jgi:DNA-binding transcriptional MerR regulator
VRIGQLADRCGLTTTAIRYYESIGLLVEPCRTPSGYREYADDAIERLRFVRDAQTAGLTLDEVHSILRLKDAGARSCDHTVALLERHIDDIDAQIERLALARRDLVELAERAGRLDPGACTDPHRCQVIDA